MLKFIIILVLAFLVGSFGWSQIIGSLQRGLRGPFLFTFFLWIAIIAVGAYFAIAKFEGLIPLLIGYGASLIFALKQGKIE